MHEMHLSAGCCHVELHFRKLTLWSDGWLGRHKETWRWDTSKIQLTVNQARENQGLTQSCHNRCQMKGILINDMKCRLDRVGMREMKEERVATRFLAEIRSTKRARRADDFSFWFWTHCSHHYSTLHLFSPLLRYQKDWSLTF